MILFKEKPERQPIKDWQSWFAWRPVKLRDGGWAWLETVEYEEHWHHYKVYEGIFLEIRVGDDHLCARDRREIRTTYRQILRPKL